MAKYKTKKKAGKTTSSCALCKPHKHGWAPKETNKQQALTRAHQKEIRDAQA